MSNKFLKGCAHHRDHSSHIGVGWVSAIVLLLLVATPTEAAYRLLNRPPGGDGLANGTSTLVDVSNDGGVVLFSSAADNLGGSNAQGQRAFFLQTLDANDQPGTVQPVLPGANASISGARMSGDGRWLVFSSRATNLHPDKTNGDVTSVFLFNRETGELVLVPLNSENGFPTLTDLNADGRYALVRQTTTSGTPAIAVRPNIYLYDRLSGDLRLVSNRGEPITGSGLISDDGEYLLFNVGGDDYQELVLHHRASNSSQVLFRAVGAFAASRIDLHDISSDGQYALFSTSAVLSPEDTDTSTDVYLYDRLAETYELLDRGDADGGLFAVRNAVRMTRDARIIVFASFADDLVEGDVNGTYDIFVLDRDDSSVRMLRPQPNNRNSSGLEIDADASTIVVGAAADNFVSGDTNGFVDIFLFTDEDDETVSCGDRFPAGIWRSSSGVTVQVAGSDSCLGGSHYQWGKLVEFGMNIPATNERGALQLYARESFNAFISESLLLARNQTASNEYFFAAFFRDPATGYDIDMVFVDSARRPTEFELAELVVSAGGSVNRSAPIYQEYGTRWTFEEGGSFDNPPPAASVTLGGRFWEDATGDGRFDSGDTPVAGVEVTVHRCGDQDGVVAVLNADDEGSYLSATLDARAYQFVVRLPAGRRFAPPRFDSQGELISVIRLSRVLDGDVETGWSDCVNYTGDRFNLDMGLEVLR